jgi:DegV family protein with EDD domain
MAKVGIITDTIACLPPEKIKEYDIRIVPIAMTINGKPLRDQVDITPEQFWKQFNEVKEFTTGAPPMTDFTDIFKDLAKSTNNIACTFVSKALSATYEAAVQARDLFKKDNPNVNIELIDSRTAAGAQAFIAMEMGKASKAGKSLHDVVKAANDMIPKVKFFCAMETLKYLIKSGRAPKTAYMGELFQVKPIIGMVNNTGVVENLGRVRGKEKSFARMVEMIGEHADTSKPLYVFCHYTNSIEDGELLKKMVTDKYKCEEVYLTSYTPVMSGHTGPVVAVAFYS